MADLDRLPITLPWIGLLNLVPWFKETLATIMRKEEVPMRQSILHSQSEGTTVLDEHNSPMTVIVKDKQVPDNIIDEGSGVNVISKATYDRLIIKQWEICTCWLRMTDTSSV